MPEKTCSPNGWTIDTLETYLSKRIDALQEHFSELSEEREDRNKERFLAMKTAVDAALLSSDRAISKAEQATEKRFEGVNEFREALADQSATLLPRTEYSVQHKGLNDLLTLCTDRLAEHDKVITTIVATQAATERTKKDVADERRQQIAGVYYLVAGAGVVFGIIMSAIGFFFAHFGLSR